ncbi:MAG: hydroxyethylthiazole kinase [Tidjanibacter sp.]|nr:hydroxyethylthiazole kinase [Tidjanibacter sp.]
MINRERFIADVEAVRRRSPLVHNITNYVAMNNSANALLAIGASPVMAHWTDEMADMTAIAGALVINIGTLDSQWIEGMLAAGKAASLRGTPIVLDPVGAGATPQRTATALRIIEECKPTIIRGNGSEIMALVDASVKSKGVDSSASSHDALGAAKSLAQSSGAVVVISGPTDYITDGQRVETITNGNPIMTSVTAMGCTASSIVGAFAAVNADAFEASCHAMAVMGIAGQRAASYSKGNGSMQVNFLDELYNFSPTEAAQMLSQE